MMQQGLTEPLFHEQNKITRSARCGFYKVLALSVCLSSALLATQMPSTRSVGVKFISSGTYPLNMAWISPTRGSGTMTQYDNYGGPAHPSNTISQQSLERAMTHYGSSSRYEASTVKPYSRIHDYHYPDYHYRDYPTSLRFQDYRYRHSDYHPRGRYVHEDEVTFGPQGESHVASFRFRPGESEIFPMGRYGGGYYNRYRGGYHDSYRGGYYNGYR